MTALTQNAIYDVLVELAGAREDHREMFLRNWPACREFRFGGHFGFGGKVWHDPLGRMKPYVSCYPEDWTPKREALAKEINARLAAL